MTMMGITFTAFPLLLAALFARAAAFAPCPAIPRTRLVFSASPAAVVAAASSPDVVVISPPGGIGEIASLEAARLGKSVKWFVVSSSSSPSSSSTTTTVSLTSDSLSAIETAGGSLEFAGVDAARLLASDGDDEADAASAVAQWCRGTKAVVCTYDGAVEEERRVNKERGGEEPSNPGGVEKLIRRGIRVAAREAVGVADAGAAKVVALYSGEEMGGKNEANQEEKKGFLDLFRGNENAVPDTLVDAMKGAVNVVRYGELFGAPESSPESSPFVGGPRVDPIIRDMYTMRSIRIDPTISVSGNILSGGSKSNRLAVGSAITRLSLTKVDKPDNRNGIDVALSSYPGTMPPTEEEWNAEFDRVVQMISSPTGGATLFTAEFSSVPSTKRLAEWIATKWAPVILRSYDIAGIRVGARPVYAVQTTDDTVELVWQELVNFNPVTSGRMVIRVSENGMTASRGPGDAAAGFGAVSVKPLPGEDILVRRLADAAAQAVEKGLAVKSATSKAKEEMAAKAPAAVIEPPPTPVVTATPIMEPQAQAAASDSGPRSAGVRRSSERARGKSKSASSTEGSFE
ncbi:hypothetical protein HJC23_001843 [Cyclotella cryptica]|uniref:Uncharacterized protein n=1 Tax=Cyclotella cryptica TaxID=29204 RepID=A0ABD3Q558_9STRA|eukprot:CCRYP_009891-RA/>CCRYP_009891-RA protein AED:0.09 eAED:0.09 QI:65/1/1/1/0.75/0.6/5/1159/572